MKRNTLLVLVTLCLVITGPSIAADSTTHSHEHGTAAATLQLNAGQKWETDGALRQAMRNIHQAMSASLHQIHENRLPEKGYDALAKTVQDEVASIIASCKLEPKADAQLHLIVAELLEGAEQMAGKMAKVKRQTGAVRVIGALEKYSTYFNDAGFKPIVH